MFGPLCIFSLLQNLSFSNYIFLVLFYFIFWSAALSKLVLSMKFASALKLKPMLIRCFVCIMLIHNTHVLYNVFAYRICIWWSWCSSRFYITLSIHARVYLFESGKTASLKMLLLLVYMYVSSLYYDTATFIYILCCVYLLNQNNRHHYISLSVIIW